MEEARPEHAVELADLEMWVFPENCMNERTLRGELERGRGWFIRVEGRIVAYAFGYQDGVLFDLLRLGVHPRFQGRGLGTRLLDGVLAALEGASMLTVRKGNTQALQMYLRRGFRIVGQLEGGAWVMKRGD